MREAYQSKIGQRILTTRLRVNLNPNFREARLLQQLQQQRTDRQIYGYPVGSICWISAISNKPDIRILAKYLSGPTLL